MLTVSEQHDLDDIMFIRNNLFPTPFKFSSHIEMETMEGWVRNRMGYLIRKKYESDHLIFVPVSTTL